MFTCLHPSNDVSETNNFLLLTTPQGIRLEEGNHFIEQVKPPTNDEHVPVVISRAAVIFPHRSATKLLSDEIGDLFPANILADAKLRH